jgi:Fe-S cluster assembly iron-binding protein IscA
MHGMLLIYAALFLLGALHSLRSETEALIESGACLAIALSLAGLSWFVRRQEQQRVEFLTWLRANMKAVQAGGQWYGDSWITRETELRQYEVAASFLIVSVKAESRYYLSGTDSGVMTAIGFLLVSVLAGWWGWPFGPYFTVQAIGANLSGGKRVRVQDLLDCLTQHEREVVRLTERGAEHARDVMKTRGFPDTTAIQVEVEQAGGETTYEITFDDQPPENGTVWKWESHGVRVIVAKRIAAQVEGLTVDAWDGEFVFKPGQPLSQWDGFE